ncbi:MAG: ABC transporter substrate-binding protein [Ilumatobacteraceae bacterium]
MRTSAPHRRRRGTLVAVIATFALVAAACSASDDSGDAGGTTEVPTPDQGDDDTSAPSTDADPDGDSNGDSNGDGDSDGDDGGPTTTAGEAPSGDPDSELAAQCPVDALDDADGPVAIDVWHSMTVELEETLRDMVAEYNDAQDRVDVRLVFQGTYNESLDKYLTALRGGTRPQVVQLEETALQLGVDSGSFVPVQACVDASGYSFDDHITRTVTAYTVEDVLWPMPFNTSNPVLYANMAALREAGIDELPTTLAEVRTAAEAVVSSGVAPNGISLTSSSWIIEQLFALADEEYVDGGNGRAERATGVLFDSDLGLEIFTWLHDMVADGLATYVGSGDDAEHFIALALGQAAMTMDTTAALRSVLIGAEDFPEVEVAVGPLPSVGERDGGVLVGGAALWIDGETSDVERAAAWDFLTWLNEPQQQATWHTGTGYVPIRQSAADLPEVTDLWAEEPAFRVAYDQLVDGAETTATAGPVIGNHARLRQEALIPALEGMYLSGLSPEAAIAQAAAGADAIIADYTRRIGG